MGSTSGLSCHGRANRGAETLTDFSHVPKEVVGEPSPGPGCPVSPTTLLLEENHLTGSSPSMSSPTHIRAPGDHECGP